MYLWLGITFCQILFAIATRRTSMRQLVKGLGISVAVYVAAYFGMLACFLAFPYAYAVDITRVNPISLVLNPALMLVTDIPFIVAMLSGVLLATPTRQHRAKEVAR